MAKTKVKEFSACRIEDVNSLLDEVGVTYVDLKVIQGRRRADASLLLVYKEGEPSPSSIGKRTKTLSRLSGIIPRPQTVLETVKELASRGTEVPLPTS